MSRNRNYKRFLEGKNSMFDAHKHNNRKTNKGRWNQYVPLENGKTKRIQHITHY